MRLLLVDFGHAKQIFEEADVFPSIIVARRPADIPKPATARLCTIPREQLRIDDLSEQIDREGVEMELSQLRSEAWQLEPKSVVDLLRKIQEQGKPLAEFVGVKPYRGIVTGCNDAFLIDTKIKNELVAADPKSSEIIQPYLRGQDIARWHSEWSALWMIFARRGIDIEAYPSVKQYLLQFRQKLEPKPKDWTGNNWLGRKPGPYKWFEIQDSIEYWQEFGKPKIVYQVIQYHPRYSLDNSGMLGNDKMFLIPKDDFYLLAVLNSPLLWWHNWRNFTHLKDEALSPMGYMMEALPISYPTDYIRTKIEQAVHQIINFTKYGREICRDVFDWLRTEHEIHKPSRKLRTPSDLDSDAFVAEVKRLRGKKNPLSVAALRSLRDEYNRTIEPARIQAAEALNLEHQISDLVNEAYGLTPDEVALMWQTAPPRMPIPKPM